MFTNSEILTDFNYGYVNGKPPIVLYPGECWYGGCNVAECPKPGAIKLNIPLMNSIQWKRKNSGE